MSDFKAKMQQNRFRMGLCRRQYWGSYNVLQRSPDFLVVIMAREMGDKGPVCSCKFYLHSLWIKPSRAYTLSILCWQRGIIDGMFG